MIRLTFTILTLLASAGLSKPVGGSLGSSHRRKASSGCGRAPAIAPNTHGDAQTASGRQYRVYVPDSYDQNRATPLILSFHGLGGTIEGHAQEARLHEEVYNTGQIIVYLQGLENSEGQGTWFGAPGVRNDDIGFTHDVLDALENQYCVDTARMYATGMSQGGGFVGQLACDPGTSTRLAAFAPVAGAFYIESVTDEADCDPDTVRIPCAPGRVGIPITEFHGGDDDTIHFEGGMRKGACLPSITHWVEEWSIRNGAGSESTTQPIAGTDGGQTYEYEGGQVRLVYAGHDVGHVWESNELGTADIEATRWIIDFFQSHSL